MRESAREIGLVQVLIDILKSAPTMASEGVDRLNKALELLGVTDNELRRKLD